MLPILLFFLSLPAFCQESSLPCPSISISGPAGVPNIGDKIPFSLSIGKEIELYSPTYRWSATTGDIILGKDNRSVDLINADLINKSLTVTVQIDGLPQGCPNVASETMSYDPPLQASKLFEIKGSLAEVSKSRFDEILSALNHDPVALLYVTIAAGNTSSTTVKRKRSDILKLFGSPAFRAVLQNGTSVVYVNSDKKDNKVAFWLVPPGANSPQP